MMRRRRTPYSSSSIALHSAWVAWSSIPHAVQPARPCNRPNPDPTVAPYPRPTGTSVSSPQTPHMARLEQPITGRPPHCVASAGRCPPASPRSARPAVPGACRPPAAHAGPSARWHARPANTYPRPSFPHFLGCGAIDPRAFRRLLLVRSRSGALGCSVHFPLLSSTPRARILFLSLVWLELDRWCVSEPPAASWQLRRALHSTPSRSVLLGGWRMALGFAPLRRYRRCCGPFNVTDEMSTCLRELFGQIFFRVPRHARGETIQSALYVVQLRSTHACTDGPKMNVHPRYLYSYLRFWSHARPALSLLFRSLEIVSSTSQRSSKAVVKKIFKGPTK